MIPLISQFIGTGLAVEALSWYKLESRLYSGASRRLWQQRISVLFDRRDHIDLNPLQSHS